MKSQVVAAVTVAVAGFGFAETNKVTELQPVVVYGSRIEEPPAEMPASVQIYEAEQIAASGARDLPEFLDKGAKLHVRRMNANPLQAHVAMRGFGEWSFGRVKVVVDGEELNQVDMEMPNLARIPLGNVERIEVIGGASPVLYGDGAVAGVINIVTDQRDYSQRTKLQARGGSYGNFGANFSTRGGIEEEGLLYSAGYDYDRSDGFREHSAYDMHAFNAALRKNFENGSTLGLKANYFNAFYEMPGSLTLGQWKHDRRQSVKADDWCRVWNYGVSFDAKAKLAEDQWLFLDGSFSVKHRKSHWTGSNDAYEYDLYGYQFSPRYVNETALFGHESKFTLGTEFRFDRNEVSDPSGWNNPSYHFDRGRYALFAEEEFFITEELSVVAGARGEYIDNRWSGYKGLKDAKSHDVMGDFELGLVYRPIEGMKTYAKGTRFHRSAFCDELSYTENGEFLDPETGSSLDIGMEYEFLEEFKFEVVGYWSVMEDEIFYNPYAKDYGGYFGGYNCNSPGKTERLGMDTSLGWDRDKVAEASVHYSFVKADFRDGQYSGDEIPLVPESRVRAEAGVWIFDDLEVKGGYSYVTAQYLCGDFNNAHERLEGYSVFDIGAYYAPSWAEGWKASFVMDNLLDEDYCDFAGWSDYSGAYYYPACGRSFLFTVSYEF